MKSAALSLLLTTVLGFDAVAQPTMYSTVEIVISADTMRGQFFSGDLDSLRPTVLLIPGWPGSTTDVLGIGGRLSRRGLNVLVLNPRGLESSGGTMTFHRTLDDIGAALDWLRQSQIARDLRVDTASIVLGGHSFGGGIAMAYAARDKRVRIVISIAGTDHAEFIRHYNRSVDFRSWVTDLLRSTQKPDGPATFDIDESLRELDEHRDLFGLRENAVNLADRSVLLIGGWEDTNTSVEQYMLPLYRSLKDAGADDVTFLVYHANHGFRSVRERLAEDVGDWIDHELSSRH